MIATVVLLWQQCAVADRIISEGDLSGTDEIGSMGEERRVDGWRGCL